MPTLFDRARSLAGAAGRALLAYAATPAAPGFEPRSPDRPTGGHSPEVARALASPDALFGRVTYGAGPTQSRYSTYPGSGVTPEQIWNLQILRNNGYPQLWTELLEQTIERDAHLGGVYETRRLGVVDKDFRLHPATRGDDLSESLAQLMERVVGQIDSFDQCVDDLMSATAYGYAVSENVYAWRKVRLPSKAETVTLKVPSPLWVHWKHFRFDRDTDEPYLWLTTGGEQRLSPHKFIFHACPGSGLVERRGFMGACVWLSAAKRWSERDWLVYAKIFGIPNILARYPNEREEYATHRAKYVQFLKDWGEGIPALLPEDLQVEITRDPAGRSSDVHGSIIGWANAEMSKRILGSTLTVEMGGQGSWAAADTHRDAPYMRARSDARGMAATLRGQLFRSIVEVNVQVIAPALGASPDDILGAIPRCSWRIEREMGVSDRLNVYDTAVNKLGLAVDEERFREEMSLERPRAGGNALRGEPQQVSKGAALVGSLEGAQGVDNPDTNTNGSAAPAPATTDGAAAPTPTEPETAEEPSEE